MKPRMFKVFLAAISILIITSSFCFAQEKPLTPTNAFADVQDSSVLVTWTPPIDTSVIGFNIYRKEDVAGTEYKKINDRIVVNPNYLDRAVKRGTSYAYVCRSVNSDGIESNDSNLAGAPKMKMTTSAVVTHMGRQVNIAVPGDVIKYDVDFVNRGFGIAREVIIVHAIPRGTTFIAGTAKCPKYGVKITYFDKETGNWVDTVSKEQNVSKVRFTLLETVPPSEKDSSGIASLKVMVNY